MSSKDPSQSSSEKEVGNYLKGRNGLKEFQSENGLFPAVPDGEKGMDNYWIRDNYFVYKSLSSEEMRQDIYEGFEKIVSNHEENILDSVENPPEREWQHIHPRYDKELEEIEGEWGWVQNDSVGNLLEVLVENNSEYSDLIYKYLNSVEYWNCEDYGFWEEEKDIHPSSIASCIRGVKKYTGRIPKKAEDKMYEELPRKDMATLSLLYPEQVVSDKMRDKILKSVEPLVGENGVRRFPGDDWNGVKHNSGEEAEWPLGFSFLYLITGKEKYFNKLYDTKSKYGTIPESFVDGDPNPNHPLTWAEAMYRACERKHIDKIRSRNVQV